MRERLRQEAQSLEQTIRKESSERNRSVTSLEKAAQAEMEQAKDAVAIGFLSHEEKEATLQKLDNTSKKLEQEAARKKRPESEKEKLLQLHEEVERTKCKVRKVRRTGTDDATAHLNRQARKVLQTVFKVLTKELPEKQFNEVQEKIHTALKPGKKTEN